MQENGAIRLSQRERDELQVVLASKTLTRSPSVLRLAEYISRKYLAGEADTIKEYTIAVEALGKSADFDPKRDSIVRVEAHRLRKKLVHYYLTEGAEHSVRVVLDPGQYIPRFELKPAPEFPVEVNPEVQPSVLVEHARPPLTRWWTLFVILGLVFVGGGWALLHRVLPEAVEDEIRIVAGLPVGPVASRLGEPWSPDKWFQGGEAQFGARSVVSEASEIPMNVRRLGDFDYDIPLARKPHELRLYFEAMPSQTRRFNIFLNGAKLVDGLDPSATSATVPGSLLRVFRDVGPGLDGKLHLKFRSGLDRAYLSALRISPGLPGRLAPIRVVAKGTPYTEPGGIVWGADRYVTGGTLIMRTDRVNGDRDPNLFTGERYGSFRYDIPVSAGHYRVTLYFAETWFGPKHGGGGIGSRRFDVTANGIPLLQDFDIFREAGRSYASVVKTFHGIRPDANGYIVLSFLPRVNYACVNAIEVVEEKD
ncbi:MAG: malectin [Acidobacteriota bacterium]|nr:malectin [Acidobacteriota bacterium]